ncbi:MAG: NUDIX hydrolase [Clostridiales bacterium]|nr:NUDIX hydrolase [Clostridiales bacterium]
MVKTINSEKVYSGGIIDVYKDRIVLENGVETSRDVVRHRQAAAVVAVNDRDELVMVEQFRYPIGKKQRELPAGLLDHGESPIEAAKRELLEETGYCAQSWTKLISLYMSPGVHDEQIHIFLAQDLNRSGNISLDEDEILSSCLVPYKKVLDDIEKGLITDGKTIVGVLFYHKLINS